MNTGKLLILTGYPASGQDTVMNAILTKHPDFSRIVTHTDRPIRPGEINGIDYHFVSTTTFKAMISNDEFFEHVLHGSHYKGTLKQEFQTIFSGKNVIWRIDPTRAAVIEDTIMERFDIKTAQQILSQTTKILIRTKDKTIARERYISRDPNHNLEEFERRYQLVEDLLTTHHHRFPHVIENNTGELDAVIESIGNILTPAKQST